MKKQTFLVAAAVIAVVLAFYGGTLYGNSKDFPQNSMPQFDQRQGQNNFQSKSGRMGGANFTDGTILSKDDKSITIQIPDGGSKIIFYSDSTKIVKTTEGSIEDLAEKTPISINGDLNADGSITAKSIQIKTDLPASPSI